MNVKHLFNKLSFVNEQHVRIALAIGALALFVLGAGAPAGWDN
jgi:hypothetical protein